jgi:hypothetical protein
MSIIRTFRAGSGVEDYCRACKTDRMHTVVAADAEGQPIRVTCGFCRSEHNYRGGARIGAGTSGTSGDAGSSSRAGGGGSVGIAGRAGGSPPREPFPIVGDRERSAPPVSTSNNATDDLELLIRRVIREEAGISAVTPAEKWRGGTLVLRPGTAGLQEKSWPIESFFHKVVMLRNRLRTLEQQVNASDLPDDVKVKLQGYVSGCYGSLTSFNVLFADESDQFKGAGGD